MIDLVRRIMEADAASEAEHDALIDRFEASVPRPGASALIFWPEQEGFDRELTPEEVVDVALAYRPIELGGAD